MTGEIHRRILTNVNTIPRHLGVMGDDETTSVQRDRWTPPTDTRYRYGTIDPSAVFNDR